MNYQGKKYKLTAGDCVFVDCQQPYSHSTDTNLWSLSWIHFSGVTMRDIYQKYQERGGRPVFHPENITAFTELHKSLFTLASSDDYIRDMRINSSLNELLVPLMNESWHPAERSDIVLKKQNLDPIREYLDTHHTEKVSLDALTDQFFISKFYLTRMFKEQFWLSINTYVLNLRITKAKQMLRFTDKNWKILATNAVLTHHIISAAFLSMLSGLHFRSSVKSGGGRKIASRELDGKREKCNKAEKEERKGK